ncbi:LpqB family beta-propeller domain-containing protein [Bifidobacterium sp. ESL0732]|uniref:LpqB family beta-propeller domain-containing protein n=1 Tax=Bifidobacterium sp. ESL0732 TaxID=2983222 RepID=UPI0023F68228|nr:LpqB family beta-propeller domain-containing protein [Bifidobacterium sp. ESL0732]WEV63380.1 LpqB family beta-propeller domain-containing protein [Bifidobacterium sp. ESL0732]
MFVKHVKRFFIMMLAIGFSVLGSSCSNPLGFPDQGAVQRLPAIEQRSKRVFTDPHGPKAGDQPEGILRGFFDAMPAGIQSDGFHVARDFLTRKAASTWNGEALSLVIQGEPTFIKKTSDMKFSDGGQEECDIKVQIHVKGEVDNRGQYSSVSNGSIQSLDFLLINEKGQWRIEHAPDVVVVSDSDFDQVFRQVTLYRADSFSHILIPDVRWFAWRDWRSLAVKELLVGKVDWLGDSLANLNERELKLEVNAVFEENDKTHIVLNDAFSQLTHENRAMLVHEMRMTLGDGDTNYDMVVTAASQQDYSREDADLSVQNTYASSPMYSLSAGNIVSLNSSAPLRVGRVEGSEDARGFVFGALGGAVLNSDSRVTCLKSNGASCGAMFDGNLIETIAGGIKNEIWALGVDGRSVLMQEGNGSVQRFTLPWLGDATISAIAVSPDGSRLAISVQSGPMAGVVMSGIARNQAQVPVHLSDNVAHISSRSRISMLTFYNDTTLIYVIGGSSQEDAQGFQQIGPGPEHAQRLPRAQIKSIASGQISNGLRLVALDTQGVVHSISGALDGSWVIADTQVTVISQR